MESSGKLEEIMNELQTGLSNIRDRDHSSSSSSSSGSDSDHEKSIVEIETSENLVNDQEEALQVEVERPLMVENISNVTEMEPAKDLSSSINQYVAEANEKKDQNILLSLEDKNVFSPHILEASDPVTEETKAELKPKEDTADDFSLREKVDTTLEEPVDLPSVVADSKSSEREVEVEIPEHMVNQPVISLAPRARCMTSWRSCCGLFEVLRSPDR